VSRPALFGLLFLWLVVITFLVNAITTFDPASGLSISNPLTSLNSGDGAESFQVFSLLKTYWGALTFSINGLPVVFNLFFQVPTAIISYMIIGFVRGGS